MRKIILYIFSTAALITLFSFAYVNISEATVQEIPSLKDGDLVFQTINSSQTHAIMNASKSPYTHVGIIKIKSGGVPYVIEAVGPVREVSLEKWLHQGIAEKITVMRFTELKTDEIKRLLLSAEKHYGKPYDFFFLFDKDRIYCSELVYYAFKEGAGLNLGQVQKISDLNVNNATVKELIKSRWQHYEPCVSKNAQSYESCWPIIMDQELVTPASIANDPRLELVYSNYEYK